jgi:hypothetical protein
MWTKAMADIFQEVEEDLRRERAKKVWEKYGRYIIAAAVAIVLAVAAWRGVEWYQKQQAEAAGARFQDAVSLARTGKGTDAEAALGALAKDSPGGYRILTRFRLAAEMGTRDPVEAAKAYDTLAADAGVGPTLQNLAKVRAGYLLVDSASYADLAAKLEPLTGPNEPWRNSAREVLGLSAYRAKDFTTASKWFEAMLGDKDVPQPARQRAELMLQLIAADAPPKSSS